MRSRLSVGGLFFVGALVAGPFAATSDGLAPQRQWAVANFEHPTIVGTEILMGSYLVVHDEARMAHGEPCTWIYKIERQVGPPEEVVSFHCLPRKRPVVETFTMAADWDDTLGMYKLTEYQFARDAEGHGVPIAALASDQVRARPSRACARFVSSGAERGTS